MKSINNDGEKYIQVIISVILIILFIGLLTKGLIIDEFDIKTEYKYTTGNIIGFEGAAEGCPNVNFEYSINDTKYLGFFDNCGEFDNMKIGDKILLKFYPKNPNNCKLISNKPIPSIEPPKNGWKELP